LPASWDSKGDGIHGLGSVVTGAAFSRPEVPLPRQVQIVLGDALDTVRIRLPVRRIR